MLSPEIASPTEMMPSDNISARTPPRLLYASLNPVLLAAAEGIWQGRVGSMPSQPHVTNTKFSSQQRIYIGTFDDDISSLSHSVRKGTNPRRASSSFTCFDRFDAR